MAIDEQRTATRHEVARLEDFPPGSRRLLDVGRFGIGVFNVSGSLFALTNRCPHMGGPLCVGKVTGATTASRPYEMKWVRDGEILACPWHGWQFDVRTGETITKPVRKVKRYPVYVEDGVIVVEV
jgi:nitrite reductase (NADH) small subunit